MSTVEKFSDNKAFLLHVQIKRSKSLLLQQRMSETTLEVAQEIVQRSSSSEKLRKAKKSYEKLE